MMDETEIASLARKVLSFFGLELQWLASSRQLWVTEAVSGELVTAFMESPTGELLEQPLEVARDSIFLKSRSVDGSETASRAFLEALSSVKKWSYGLDVETLEPKKISDNPFFKLGSLEEIAVKLDLLAGEVEEEESKNATC